MKQHLLVLVLCICSIQVYYSQEDNGVVALNIPLRNSLTFNRFTINPTFSFVREQDKYISLSNKREWVEFEDAPLTYLASYSGRFGENMGAGIAVFQQNYGVLTTFGGLLNFAYNARLDRDSNLTFGLNIGAYKSGLNTGKVVTNFDDPSLENVPENFLITVNPGINYGTGFFDFGISLKNIVAYNLESSMLIEENPEQGIQGHIMYTGYLDTRDFFDESKFTGLLKSEFRTEETIISGLLMITVPKGIWAQVGYNTIYGASGGLGLNISPQIAIEYNFEKALGDLTEFGPSHEISLAYRFKSTENYEYSSGDEVAGLISGNNKNRKKKKATKPQIDRKAIAEQKAQEQAAADAKRLAEQKAQEQAAADAKRLAEQKAQEQAAADAKRLAEQKAQEQAAADAKRLAEQKDNDKAAADAKRLAEQKAQEQAAADAKRLAEQQANDKAAADAKRLAEQQAKEQAAADAKRLAEQQAKDKTATDAKRLAEQQAKEQAADDAKRLAEQQANDKAAADAKLLAEQQAKDKTAADAKRLAEQQAKDKTATDAKRLAEQQAKEQAAAAAKRLAEQQAKDKTAADAKRLAEQQAKDKAAADAKRLAEQQAKEQAADDAKRLAEQQANDKAAADAKLLAEVQDKEDAVLNPTDQVGKAMLTITKETEELKTTQNELLQKFDNIVEIKNQDLQDLKEEYELSLKGIVAKPKPFKSIAEENNTLNAIKSDLEAIIETRNEEIEALKKLYDDNSDNDFVKLEGVNLYYRKAIERLELEQKEAEITKNELNARLKDINIATEFERKRRIKRAAYDNDEQRYLQDRTTLQNLKKTTTVSTTLLTSDDFDFGEIQNKNIQILKDIKNIDDGYYLVLAVHSDTNKRDDFVKKVIKSGSSDVDFFYDLNSSTYYIYINKYDNIQAVNRALESKENKPYNINMSVVKIEN
ncbi:type IX secretion system membrane protein PorP/SprF [Bizionia saleffrena]|uniref:Type IX secretion system membrane protein PorP/SprF n=1 Tax=Bizionia saleffrena TaxID=291189 RepID=A0A8H2QM30_9FLAO|nr:PorP/SprF family type IX secretion system membrane protein [Bizionia saleffrena]TYB76662.1 type IX secretion system membrane protein PorP/SprF [Bizionia saleffrena]